MMNDREGNAGGIGLRHFSLEGLRLRDDASGARYWAVSLGQAQLTYFEVPPGTRFDEHRHANEQITLVLEGELVFESKGAIFRVRAGEAIAVPSNVPHAVRAGEQGARAVDAWSPLMEAYAAK